LFKALIFLTCLASQAANPYIFRSGVASVVSTNPLAITRYASNSNYVGTTTLDVGSFQVNGFQKVLVATIAFDDFSGESISSVVWDPAGVNEALTLQESLSVPGLAVYSKIAPTDATAPVRVTFSGSVSFVAMGAMLVNGAHQTTPFGTFDTKGPESTTTSVLPIAQYLGGIVVSVETDPSGGNIVSAPFSKFNSTNPGSFYFGLYHASTGYTGSSSITCTWNSGAGGGGTWIMAQIGFCLLPY
jgi:hypothetical protein